MICQMRNVLFIITYLIFIGCSSSDDVFWSEKTSPQFIGQKVTADLLGRPDYMMYISDHCTAVHYSEVCAAYGATKLAALLNDSATIQKLSERYMRVIDDSITNTKNHVDANVYGILPLELYRYTKNEKFYKQGIELADIQWQDPLENGLTRQTRFWIDDVYMIGSLQIQAYRLSGEQKYLQRAALETAAYLEKLQQPNGLFHHGPEAPFFWGRGNGWMAAGLAEVISELPEDNPYYQEIISGYSKMMQALLKYQAEDGMWRQLLDQPQAWKETSCTAMFGYAISVGVKKGILEEKNFKAAYQKAWLALNSYINKDGQISDVCVGTGQSKDIKYYLERPKVTGDFHGQAPLLWFACSLLSKEL